LLVKFDMRAGNAVSRREVLANIAPVFNWQAPLGSPFCSSSLSSSGIHRKRCLYFNGQFIAGITIAVYIGGHLDLRIAVWYRQPGKKEGSVTAEVVWSH
jgi:hypothetical protein